MRVMYRMHASCVKMPVCELTSPRAARTKTYHAKFQCHATKIHLGDLVRVRVRVRVSRGDLG